MIFSFSLRLDLRLRLVVVLLALLSLAFDRFLRRLKSSSFLKPAHLKGLLGRSVQVFVFAFLRFRLRLAVMTLLLALLVLLLKYSEIFLVYLWRQFLLHRRFNMLCLRLALL